MPVRSSVPEDHVYTVTELTRKVKGRLEGEWSGVRVEGELSNVKYHGSGHVYFTLKDERASISAAFFRSDAVRARFRLEDGQKIRVYGGLTLYAPQGRFQILVKRVEAVGTGDLEIAFRQLWEKLSAEGLFDDDRKRPVPEYPGRIGVVTSGTGAALQDIRTAVERRAPHVALVLRPARVQGEGAARDIAAAIAELDAWGGCDTILVARGGGSLEDLWAFNEEIVARAIAACDTPVVTGIGHEVDTTIADFTADLRAATPTAAAELATPAREELLAEIEGQAERLGLGMRRLLRVRRDRVMLLAGSRAFRDPLAYCRQRAQDVDRIVERLGRAGARRMERVRLRFEATIGRLDALSPLAILGRGYAIARVDDGRVLRRATEVEPGDALEILLAEGALGCRVEELREDERPRPLISARVGEENDGGA
jgi:exodeoxyribonuclease VII large subunit